MVLICIKHNESEIINNTISEIEDKSKESYFKQFIFNIKFFKLNNNELIMKIKIPIIDYFLLTLTIGFISSLIFILILTNFKFTFWLLIPIFTGFTNLIVFLINTDIFWFWLLKKSLRKKGYKDNLEKIDIETMFEKVLENGSK